MASEHVEASKALAAHHRAPGKKESKAEAKKHLPHLHIRPTKDRKFIVEHQNHDEHDMPVGPKEEYAPQDIDQLHDHLEEHYGTPNPGEAEADAGSDAGVAPQAAPPQPE